MAYVVDVEANIFYEKSVISERHCRSAAKTAKKTTKDALRMGMPIQFFYIRKHAARCR